MIIDPRKARDLALLDAIDSFDRENLAETVWRVVREGRDPLQGSRSHTRWCNDTFDVLYTSLERDGALAEVYARLSGQPVFPSRIRWFVHRIKVRTSQILRLANLATLAKLGVETARYRDPEYKRTQEIADAAYFLGFDGLITPNARWDCLNIVLFTDRIPPGDIVLESSERDAVDWPTWKKSSK